MSRGGAHESESVDAAGSYNRNSTSDERRGNDDERERLWTNDDFSSDPDPDLGADDLAAAELFAGVPGRAGIAPAIRRRAQLWIATALVGLVLGAGLYHYNPPGYKAQTLVLLRQTSPGQAPDQMLTDVALAQSRTVAAAAMRQLGLPVSVKSVQGFIGHYTVTSLTDQVLQIVVKAPSSRTAVRWANVVAAALLQVMGHELNSQLTLTTAALNKQIGFQQRRLNSLAARISTASAKHTSASRAEVVHLTFLQHQASATLQDLENAVGSYVANAKVANAAQLRSSTILDQATPLPRGRLKYPLLYVGGGMIAGLVIGIAFVAVQAIVSSRPRRREDVARALGAPVQLSVGRVRLRRWPGRTKLTAAPDRSLRLIVAHLRGALPERSGMAALAVVAADDPVVPVVAVLALAARCAAEGRRVVVADLSPGARAGRLLGITDPGLSVADVDGRKVTVAVPDHEDVFPIGPVREPGSSVSSRAARFGSARGDLSRACNSADVLLTVTALDPALGGDYLATWASDAVVILTAGESSATKISALGEMIRLTGVSTDSAILLSADRSDESLGAWSERRAELRASVNGEAGSAEDVERLIVPRTGAMETQPSGSFKS